jgi:hypothetical protein
MKAYKIEILVIDSDKVGMDELTPLIEQAQYPNDCVAPKVLTVKEADIGQWHDDHPLNKRNTFDAALKEYFKE